MAPSVVAAKLSLFEKVFADANGVFLHQFAHGGTDSRTVLLFNTCEHAVGFVDGQNAVVVLAVVVGWTTNPVECVTAVAKTRGTLFPGYSWYDAGLNGLREFQAYHIATVCVRFRLVAYHVAH